MTTGYRIIPHDDRNWRIDYDIVVEDKQTKKDKTVTRTLGYYPGLQSAARGLFNEVAKQESPQITTYEDMINVIDRALKRVEAVARSLTNNKPIDLEPFAELVDRIDNLCAAMTLPVPAETHLNALRDSFPEIRNELKAAYLKAGGEDVWDIKDEVKTER